MIDRRHGGLTNQRTDDEIEAAAGDVEREEARDVVVELGLHSAVPGLALVAGASLSERHV